MIQVSAATPALEAIGIHKRFGGVIAYDDVNLRVEKGRIHALLGENGAGKSTLVNAFLGAERMIVADQPGTTRDSVRVPLDRNDQHFILIDTAGVRRKSRVREAVEKYSVVKTLQAIAESSVAILVIDAQQGLVEQDKCWLTGYYSDCNHLQIQWKVIPKNKCKRK